MKKEIRLILEYGCYPVWIYDEKGVLLENGFVEEIENNDNLKCMLYDLQNKFEGLYVNTKEEFSYIGIKTDNEKNEFQKLINCIYEELCVVLNDKYSITNMIDIGEM